MPPLAWRSTARSPTGLGCQAPRTTRRRCPSSSAASNAASRTHAFLVAENGGEIAGFAYAGAHRERPAYRWTAEASVYLSERYRGRGLGRALYEPLFALLEEQGYRTVLAGIAIPNPASVALHASLGFEEVGVYRRVGWKAGDWRDVMWMARQFGPDTHEAQAPPSPGAPVRLAQPIEC